TSNMKSIEKVEEFCAEICPEGKSKNETEELDGAEKRAGCSIFPLASALLFLIESSWLPTPLSPRRKRASVEN
ncbi:unnamed protein product, partial [Heterotrigona itama]